MTKVFTAVLLILLAYTTTFAQISVSGHVYDQETKEPLVGVTILIPNTSHGTITDVNGRFNLSLNPSEDSIQVQSIGYESQRFILKDSKDLNIGLKSSITSMNEVVVTGNRDTQIRAEVPMAISKVNATTINETKATLLTEIINKVPGVAMLNLNNEQHGMSIRQPMGTSAYYLYMEDGVPLRPMGVFNHNALIEMNLFAISNIEVVKGPASSLYGPEAVGGTINFISQRPTAIPTARLGIQLDNFGYKRIQYSAGGKINNKLGVFIGGFYAKQQDSWMTYSDYDKNAINARIDYQLTPSTLLTLATSYNDYYSETPGSVDSISFYNREYKSSSDFTYRAVKSLRTRVSVDHQWNNNNSTLLHLIYRENSIGQNPAYSIKWKAGETTATGEINDNSFTSTAIIAQHSLEIPLIKTRIIGGVSVDLSPVTYDAYSIDLAAQLRPDGKSVEKYTLVAERPDVVLANYDADLINSATYLQAEIKPLNHLTITLGARYDDMRFTYTNYLDNSEGEKSYHQITPKIGATYQITDNAGAYVNYSQGFSPPALTSIFRKKPNTNPAEFYYNLEAAQFTNYEIGGWISLFNNKMDFDAALYEMIGRNELLNVKQPDNSTDYQSAGKTLHRGIEFGFTYRPNTQWTIRFGGTNALHRYEEFLLSTKTTDVVQNVNGKIMPSSPKWISNSELTYKPKFVHGLRIGVEWQVMSWWYQNQVNTVKYNDKGFLGVEGISVLNIRVGYQWKGIELFTHIMNATDELYAYNATRGNAATNQTTFTAAPPRTFVMGIQYNFNGKK